MKSIWVNTLVKNEERYLWFAVKSVIDHVDRMLLWDTGSSDNTVEIVKLLQKEYPHKIEFKQVGEVDADSFTRVRQQMLEQTVSDWLIVLDGDEVWWEGSIQKLTDTIRKQASLLDTIVNPYINLVGDIYHYQDLSAGRYKIDGKTGHLTIRAMNRKIPGLHLEKPHGTQGFFDGSGVLIQERNSDKRIHLEESFLHFTHLQRSSSVESDKKVPKRANKYKHELGIPFPLDYFYPEVFFIKHPDIVPSPWVRMDSSFLTRSLVSTPLRKLKRRLIKGKVGY